MFTVPLFKDVSKCISTRHMTNTIKNSLQYSVSFQLFIINNSSLFHFCNPLTSCYRSFVLAIDLILKANECYVTRVFQPHFQTIASKAPQTCTRPLDKDNRKRNFRIRQNKSPEHFQKAAVFRKISIIILYEGAAVGRQINIGDQQMDPVALVTSIQPPSSSALFFCFQQ